MYAAGSDAAAQRKARHVPGFFCINLKRSVFLLSKCRMAAVSFVQGFFRPDQTTFCFAF